jgi:periplasmic protein TonB
MKFPKLLMAIILGGVTTFGLFFLMNELVNNQMEAPDQAESVKIPDMRMPDTKIENRFEEAKPEKPQEPDVPPPELPEPDFVAPDAGVGGLNMDFQVAKGGLEIGGPTGLNLGEGNYMPIVTVAHEYPSTALSRGMEGSCTVVFTVTETGAVKDAAPVPELCINKKDGQPTTVWNRASVKAVSKFKFKPKVEDGKAVEVPGVRYKLTYQMAK